LYVSWSAAQSAVNGRVRRASAAHSHKTVQTLDGDFFVVAYSRVCTNTECDEYGTRFHADGHLRVSPPYCTYGLDVIAFVGIQRDREEPRRWLTRLHRDPAQVLAQVDEQFYMVVNAQVAASASAPPDSY